MLKNHIRSCPTSLLLEPLFFIPATSLSHDENILLMCWYENVCSFVGWAYVPEKRSGPDNAHVKKTTIVYINTLGDQC